MTGAAWSFGDLEFKALCDEYRRGNLPEPFTFTSRIVRAEPYAAEIDRLRQIVRGTAHPEFQALARAIAAPEVFLVAHSWSDFAHSDPETHVRGHALVHGEHCFVLTQRPGETLWHSRGFDVVARPRAELAATLLALYGEVAAGALPGVAAAPPGERSPFLEAPATASGFVKVLSGARGADGERSEVGMFWRDFTGDGRYAQPLHRSARFALPMGAAELAAWATEQIADVLPAL